MKQFFYSVNPDIVNIISNRDYIPYFSYGEHLVELASSRGAKRYKIEMTLNVVKDVVHPSHLNQRFHFCYGCDGCDEIYYERPLGLGITAKLYFRNLLGNTELIVNESYYKYVRAKVDNLYPAGAHLADIMTFRLLDSGYIPLHCACISNKQGGIILAAPPDTGKTTTAISAARNGFGFLAEDIVIADETHVYANPNTGTFFHLEGLKRSMSLRDLIFKFIYFRIPFLSYFVSTPDLSITKVLKDIEIEEMSQITKILILDKGNNTVEKVGREEALKRLLIINRNEFSYHKNSLLFAYFYFNSQSLDLYEYMRKEEDVIRNFVQRYECYTLKATDSKQYYNLMLKVVS